MSDSDVLPGIAPPGVMRRGPAMPRTDAPVLSRTEPQSSGVRQRASSASARACASRTRGSRSASAFAHASAKAR